MDTPNKRTEEGRMHVVPMPDGSVVLSFYSPGLFDGKYLLSVAHSEWLAMVGGVAEGRPDEVGYYMSWED